MPTGTVALPANTWTQIADGGLASVSWQNRSATEIYIAATTADSAPSGSHTDWPAYSSRTGEANIDATDLFDNAGAAYLWAYSPGHAGSVWRSHA